MSEKKSTGIPKILRELKKNGSPSPEFETDLERTYLITTINIRDGFKMSDIMSDKEKVFYAALLEIFQQNKFVTTALTSEITNIPISTIRCCFKKLCDLEILFQMVE